MANQTEICTDMTTQLLLTIEAATIFYLFNMMSNERSIHKNHSFQLVNESLMIHEPLFTRRRPVLYCKLN